MKIRSAKQKSERQFLLTIKQKKTAQWNYFDKLQYVWITNVWFNDSLSVCVCLHQMCFCVCAVQNDMKKEERKKKTTTQEWLVKWYILQQ